MSTSCKSLSKILLAALVFLFGLSVLVYEGHDVVLPPLARWLDVGVVPRSVDFVVSLPGDEQHRPFVAAALVNVGLAQKVLVPRTITPPEVADGILPPTHEITVGVLRYRGVPDEKIVVLNGQSQSTADDISLVAHYLKDHPNSTVAVVTSSFHTRRARFTVSRGLGAMADRAIMVSAPNPGFDPNKWWRTESGFRAITTEYVKLGAYWIVYGNGVWWITGATTCVVLWYVAKRLKKPRMITDKA